MTIEELKNRKRELGYSNALVAAISGIPLGTVQKFFGGATKHPRHETIRAITKALYPMGTEGAAAFPGESKAIRLSYSTPESFVCGNSDPGAQTMILRESTPAYRGRPEWKTIDDYYALPDDVRVELIDGEFYEMEAPTFEHQELMFSIAMQIRMCIDAHGSACRVFVSPVDIQLDRDQYTMVQPDVVVICDDERLKRRVCFGAPDLVVEVLSPSTRRKDLTLKMKKYINAGVREYWVVDPSSERVVTYRFDDPDLPLICGYEDRVPIGISDGQCSIDFKKIWDSARELRRED